MADDAIKSEAVFTSGAKRSELKPAYHLLPPEGLKRAAERYSLGADTYGASDRIAEARRGKR
jgi:hypothetical protein